MKRENITNPDNEPVHGDWIRDTYDSGMVKEYQFNLPQTPELDERKTVSRQWRDSELQQTDFISTIQDHPDHAKYKTYRQKLRDWPSTEDFPDTKPTL
tara:strand:+ start:131 stop:424 length:294 start_codon:yes stop_codon:yes gene_type:complete